MVTGVNSLICAHLFAAFIVSMLFGSSYSPDCTHFQVADPGPVCVRHGGLPFQARLGSGAHTDLHSATFNGRKSYLAVLVGILGTSISPYLFFGRHPRRWRGAAEAGGAGADAEGRHSGRNCKIRLATWSPAFVFSNLVMFFIILTAGATLHNHGKTTISDRRSRPRKRTARGGLDAYWLFTLGLIGTGMLGVPALAGSSAYAIPRANAWAASFQQTPKLSRPSSTACWLLRVAMGHGTRLRRVQRREAAFLVGGGQWSACPRFRLIVLLVISSPATLA